MATKESLMVPKDHYTIKIGRSWVTGVRSGEVSRTSDPADARKFKTEALALAYGTKHLDGLKWKVVAMAPDLTAALEKSLEMVEQRGADVPQADPEEAEEVEVSGEAGGGEEGAPDRVRKPWKLPPKATAEQIEAFKKLSEDEAADLLEMAQFGTEHWASQFNFEMEQGMYDAYIWPLVTTALGRVDAVVKIRVTEDGIPQRAKTEANRQSLSDVTTLILEAHQWCALYGIEESYLSFWPGDAQVMVRLINDLSDHYSREGLPDDLDVRRLRRIGTSHLPEAVQAAIKTKIAGGGKPAKKAAAPEPIEEPVEGFVPEDGGVKRAVKRLERNGQRERVRKPAKPKPIAKPKKSAPGSDGAVGGAEPAAPRTQPQTRAARPKTLKENK